MKVPRDKVLLALFIVLIVLIVSLPYLIAFRAAAPDNIFGGFLLNPLDGNSYLAKMRQGLNGDWKFTLPYTAFPGEGAYIFMFFILLGHLAGWFGSSLLFTFHFVRILSVIAMSLALYNFCLKSFENRGSRWIAFSLASLGSGLGWLAIPFGEFTADFWVAEAYPFLSAYANAHFPLAIALQIWLLTPSNAVKFTFVNGIKNALAALLLAVISPFGVIVVGLVWIGYFIWEYLRGEQWAAVAVKMGVIAIASAPQMLYYLWVSRSHIQLSAWNAQNITITPPLWDVALSLSPLIILAIWGGFTIGKSENPNLRIAAVWMGLCLIFIYIPLPLQRRFLQGIYVPLVILAVVAIEQIIASRPRLRVIFPAAIFILVLPTNIVILLTAFFAANTLDPNIYLTQSEHDAYTWLDENTRKDSLILAAPDSGLLIPAYSHNRVIYGHPFETVDAENKKEGLEMFFQEFDSGQAALFLDENQVDYILFGPREMELGPLPSLSQITPVFSAGDLTIYQVNGD